MRTFKSILAFQKEFDTDEKCRQYLEQQRWGDQPICPFCNGTNVHRFPNGKTLKCRDCRKKFTVTVGTIYENSKLPLPKWFLAVYILSVHSKGISSLQLANWLEITQKSAWFLNHRIREMLKEKNPQLFKNIVEADETYVGGKRGNKHAWERAKLKEQYGAQGYDEKAAVLGLLERGGKLTAYRINKANAETLIPELRSKVEQGATIMTDGHSGYLNLKREYNHIVINHAKGIYVVGEYHTNTLEGFWALLKRQITGIHHSISPKHLDRYCNEIAYRYNHRTLKQDERFADVLTKSAGRLKYKDLIKGN